VSHTRQLWLILVCDVQMCHGCSSTSLWRSSVTDSASLHSSATWTVWPYSERETSHKLPLMICLRSSGYYMSHNF